MHSFDLHLPTRLLFGAGHLKNFCHHISGSGHRIFLVTGKGSVKKLGYLDLVLNQLRQHNPEIEIFQGIGSNPDAAAINRAGEQARDFGADVVLGFGGGSVMDASKCVAALARTGEKDIWPFTKGQPRYGTLTGALPVAAIPTTAATGSEVTAVAVVSKPEVQGKASVGAGFLKPFISWLNPEFTTKLNAQTTSDGASDILSHVFENYLLGGNTSPLADRYSEGIIDTVIRILPKVHRNPDDRMLRGDMLWASSLALNGFQQAGRNPSQFVLHAMEHSLSGFNPALSHGRGLAALYPAYFRWLLAHGRAAGRFNQLAVKIFHFEPSDPTFTSFSFIDRFEDWLRANGLYHSLPELGINQEHYREIAEYTVRINSGGAGHLDALGPLTSDDIVDIFQATEKQVSAV